MAQSPIRIKSIDTTFRILEALMAHDGAGVTELAEDLDIPKSTINDHLLTLQHNNYVVQEHGEYRIGLRFLELGDYARDHNHLYNKSKAQINKLAERTGMLAHLSVAECGRGVIIYEMEGTDAISLDTYVGRQVHLHNTALGKAMLARMEDEDVRYIIENAGMPQETPQTITDQSVLFDELERVRDRGYAVSSEERLGGLECIAASIKSGENPTVYGAVSVCGPTGRIDAGDAASEIPQLVQQAANTIELEMKYA